MTTNHPAFGTYDIPTPFGGSAADEPPAAAIASLDTEETTGSGAKQSSYRDFLVSGVKGDIQFADAIYKEWDALSLKQRHAQFITCKTNAWFVVHRETKQVRVAATACGLRWCPLCIRSRRYVITQAVAGWVKKREKPKLLTFTLRHHTAPLKEQIAALYKFFRAIRKTPLFKKKIKGGIWFFQIKRSKDDRYWHPHIHCLVEGSYIIQKEISELWRKITHGSYIVDIRGVKDPEKAAEYVARYAAAPCRLFGHTFDQALEIVQALHGQRICGTFGTAKGVALRPAKMEDAEDWIELSSYSSARFGLGNDLQSDLIWIAWTNGTAFTGDIPDPPPKIDAAIKKELEKPRAFQTTFFEFYKGAF
jgi:hypothetical protein